MPGMFNGKATEYTEYTNTMEPYLGALIQEEKEVKSPRSPVTEAKDIDDDEVTNLAAICWNVSALNSDVIMFDRHDHR